MKCALALAMVVVVAITILEITAINHNLNGTVFASSMAALVGVGTWFTRGFIEKQKNERNDKDVGTGS